MAPKSRAFSRALARVTQSELSRGIRDGRPWPAVAKDALATANDGAAAKIHGASTAALLRIDADNGLLQSYHLGDSGFLLFGPDSRLAARSIPQMHAGGVPFQLAGSCRDDSIGLLSDSPSAGLASSHRLSRGQSIALLHSDGLVDNLSLDDIGSLVRKERTNIGNLSSKLAFAAISAGKKNDDITVIAIAIVH